MDNITEVQGRFYALNSFFRSYYSFEALSDVCEDYDSIYLALNPFTHIHNVLLYDTVISWCKLFGADTEECHWKNLLTDHNEFREHLFEALEVKPEAFRDYQLSILDFRNKWVVHYEPSYDHQKIPHLDLMFKSAVALHTHLRSKVSDKFPYSGPVSIEYFGLSVGMAIKESLKPLNKKPHEEIKRK